MTISEEENEKDIEKLVKMTGVLKIGDQISEDLFLRMSDNLKAKHPDISFELLETLRVEIDAALQVTTPIFIKQLVSIYRKHYSYDEIRELVNFYNSPLGKKTIYMTQTLSNDTINTTRKWRLSLIPRIKESVRKPFTEANISLHF